MEDFLSIQNFVFKQHPTSYIICQRYTKKDFFFSRYPFKHRGAFLVGKVLLKDYVSNSLKNIRKKENHSKMIIFLLISYWILFLLYNSGSFHTIFQPTVTTKLITFCIPISFNNSIKVCFRKINILFQFKHARHKLTQNSIFFIQKPVLIRFLRVIGVSNQ